MSIAFSKNQVTEDFVTHACPVGMKIPPQLKIRSTGADVAATQYMVVTNRCDLHDLHFLISFTWKGSRNQIQSKVATST